MAELNSRQKCVPLDLTLELTRICPLNCLICSSNAGSPYPKELGSPDFRKIIEEAKRIGCQNLCFSGGEPFQYQDLLQLCASSKCIGLGIQIYTSGNIWKSEKLCPISQETLSEVKPFVNKIIVGLQGPTSTVHESITRVKGSFDNAVLSIKRAIKQNITVEVHFVPVKLNYKYIPEMIALSKRLGVSKISFLRFVPQGRGSTYKDTLLLDETELLSLKSTLLGVMNSKSPLVRIGAPFSILGLSKEHCTAAENRATIRADGSAFPCEALKQIPCTDNNVLTNGFANVWENSKLFIDARHISAISKIACARCEKQVECRGGCPAQSITAKGQLSESLDPLCQLKSEVGCAARIRI